MSAALAIETASSYVEVCSSHDRPAWLRARRTGIGASEAAALVGEHSRLHLSHLVAEKRGLFGDDEQACEMFEWGLRHEPTILASYASPRYAGRPSRSSSTLLRSAEHPWALATLDAWTRHPEHGDIPLELKVTDFARDAWEYGPPPDFWWQLQHQMLVTGAPCASIACLLGPLRLVWCDVARDEAAIRRLVIAGRETWDLIQSDREPPGPYDRETMAVLWPSSDGSEIELGESFLYLDRERLELVAARKAATDRLDAIDDEIRAAMRTATTARLLDGRTTYSLKTQQRKEHVVKASEFRVLRRHARKEG